MRDYQLPKEPFDPQKTCSTCCHMSEVGKCAINTRTEIMAFNHRLCRCQMFEAKLRTSLGVDRETART
jgi:hypothetical protein